MTKECAGCMNAIPNGERLRCCNCEKWYDLECANVPVKTFRFMSIDNRSVWTCAECRSIIPKGDNTNIPVRPAQQSPGAGRAGIPIRPVQQQQSEAGRGKPKKLEPPSVDTVKILPANAPTSPRETLSPKSDIANTPAHNGSRFSISVQEVEDNAPITRKILKDIIADEIGITLRSLALEQRQIREVVDSFQQAISFFSGRYDEIKTTLEEKSEKNYRLEKENISLHEAVQNLSKMVNISEQHVRSSNIEIQCAPENKSEILEAEQWARRQSGPMVNPSFEPDDFLPQSLSPVKEEKGAKRPGDNGIFLVNMKEKNLTEVEEYEPYENRTVDHPTNNTETLLHLLKGSLGTGILAMPKAFSNSGYIVGSIGTIVIGVLCTYCIHVLLDSCYVLCKRRKVASLSYTAAAEAALSEGPDWCKACAPYAAHVVNAFLLVYQIGTCCVYVVFVSENIQFVLSKQFKLDVTVSQVMLCILLPLVLINWVKDLKYLAPFSAIANAVTIVSFAIICYYIFREAPTLEGKVPAGKLANFPLFFGTVLFALEAIGVILPLENEMKTPKDFVGKYGVLNRAMITIIILYVGMGLFGYLQYGDAALGSITLNLPSGTEVLAAVVQCLLAFAIFITHGLACYVAIDILWNEYIGNRMLNSKHRTVWEYLLRTAIVALTVGIAAAVPALDLFISLFGALCLSALGLAFPAIIQSCTYWYYVSRSERIRMIIKNAIVVLFGVLGLVVGTWTSLEGIIHKFSGSHEDTVKMATTEIITEIITESY